MGTGQVTPKNERTNSDEVQNILERGKDTPQDDRRERVGGSEQTTVEEDRDVLMNVQATPTGQEMFADLNPLTDTMKTFCESLSNPDP